MRLSIVIFFSVFNLGIINSLSAAAANDCNQILSLLRSHAATKLFLAEKEWEVFRLGDYKARKSMEKIQKEVNSKPKNVLKMLLGIDPTIKKEPIFVSNALDGRIANSKQRSFVFAAVNETNWPYSFITFDLVPIGNGKFALENVVTETPSKSHQGSGMFKEIFSTIADRNPEIQEIRSRLILDNLEAFKSAKMGGASDAGAIFQTPLGKVYSKNGFQLLPDSIRPPLPGNKLRAHVAATFVRDNPVISLSTLQRWQLDEAKVNGYLNSKQTARAMTMLINKLGDHSEEVGFDAAIRTVLQSTHAGIRSEFTNEMIRGLRECLQ